MTDHDSQAQQEFRVMTTHFHLTRDRHVIETYLDADAARAGYLAAVAQERRPQVGGGSGIGPHRTGYTLFQRDATPNSTLSICWTECLMEDCPNAVQDTLF